MDRVTWRKMLSRVAPVVALALAHPALAAIVTFDDVAGNNNAIITTATSGGYTFTSTHFHVIDNTTQCGFGGCVSNGTNYAAEDAPTLAGPVTMTRASGGTFSLLSFDGAELFLSDASASAGGFPNADRIRVEGYLAGGGSILADFILDGLKDGAGGVNDFQTFAFDATWTNLASVVWYGTTFAGSNASMAFDNINVVPGTVPEPSTVLLLSAGILAFATRRRRQAA